MTHRILNILYGIDLRLTIRILYVSGMDTNIVDTLLIETC